MFFNENKKIRVFFENVSNEDGHESWIAQGLEHDLVAQGASLYEVEEKFKRALMACNILGTKYNERPFVGFRRAPQDCFDRYKKAEYKKDFPLPFRGNELMYGIEQSSGCRV